MTPTVSVVIPTYNAEPWIAETLESVFNQTRLPDEVIVVDDASTDGTLERVTAVAVDAPIPVRVVRRSENSGSPAPTLNAGLKRATGEFIAILDHDDVFLPTKLERQLDVLSGNDALAFVFSLFGTHQPSNPGRDVTVARSRVRRIRRHMTACNGHYQCAGTAALEEFVRSINYVGGFPGFLFRRSAWEEKGGFDERLIVATDYDFLCWLCTKGNVGFIPEVHYRRREHGRNLTASAGIQWRIDAVNVMLQYLSSRVPPALGKEIERSVDRLLWDIAKRLGSAGHWQAARDVCVTLARGASASPAAVARRVLIRLYAEYRKRRGGPWAVTPGQASEASALAARVAGAFTPHPAHRDSG